MTKVPNGMYNFRIGFLVGRKTLKNCVSLKKNSKNNDNGPDEKT
jgi:hypothetical protein